MQNIKIYQATQWKSKQKLLHVFFRWQVKEAQKLLEAFATWASQTEAALILCAGDAQPGWGSKAIEKPKAFGESIFFFLPGSFYPLPCAAAKGYF